MQRNANEDHRKLFICGGFAQDGLHHHFRRKKLYRLAPLKIDSDDLGMHCRYVSDILTISNVENVKMY